MTVREWAEARREVPRGTSPEPGRWKSKPYQGPVLEAIGAPGVQGVVYVAASQGGAKTEIILNAIGFFIDADPSPQLFVTYSVEMAERLSKHRVAPMLRETPSLRGKVKEARSRDSGNTILDKEYDGGQLTLVGANSPAGLAMYPKRVALFDEIDRYPKSAGTEGDPVTLAETRTTAYWNAVKVYASSPGHRSDSRLWPLWQQSNQQEWFARCGDCGIEQVLKWAQVHWEKDQTGEHQAETAHYVCESCGSCWNDAQRWKASRNGRYIAQARFRGIAGFRVSGLAILGRSLKAIVEQWIRAQGYPEQLRVFVNTVLCEWSDDADDAQDPDELLKRREAFAEVEGVRVVPARASILTAGVDVQDDRIELEVVAWGPAEESWSLEYHVLHGDPSTAALWNELDALLMEPRKHELGIQTFIRAVAIDTGGHHTQATYKFCRPRFRRATPDGGRQYVFAIKGTAGKRPIWPDKSSRKNIGKVNLFSVGVDTAKDVVSDRLKIEEPGPGFCHFPFERTKDYFEQLTAEVPKLKFLRGFSRREWVKIKPRNEAFDARVYNQCALAGLQSISRVRIEAELQAIRRAVSLPPDPNEPPPSSPAPAPRATPARPRQGGWLGGRGRGWLR